MISTASLCESSGFGLYLAGDKKGPASVDVSPSHFISFAKQEEMFPGFAALCPANHYARKNFGYLAAMHAGATVICDLDDDNTPSEAFFNAVLGVESVSFVKTDGWLNIYNEFSEENVWPRGYPLAEIQREREVSRGTAELDCPVVQFLADGDPDVDAIYRFVGKIPIYFGEGKLALEVGTWCPFNSQCTHWDSRVFALLYLPSFCPFRMTDIWRSFIAQRLLWENGMRLAFQSPGVFQDRNEHDLLVDFKDEQLGYLYNAEICQKLMRMPFKGGLSNLGDDMISGYEAFVDASLIDRKELTLLEAWLEALP
ncbi:STELLO glycosyltransferase family protein [Pelagicoccus sp. SDUM812002]|uniref:STELLO glycosyltransferase family protein n=1 Tax=Pelagicoccus sp. SDUM812002 TaxID=3041266 RepID=UPI00280FCFE7|nr:STELLO glycosyltransferase family protein [Pelagicoccus sp. SDUM812002]MDQ8186439.1 STELLO glycosyltransferase family protein [Pelagicoccus sp. SDUM812002]